MPRTPVVARAGQGSQLLLREELRPQTTVLLCIALSIMFLYVPTQVRREARQEQAYAARQEQPSL
jgi:hypothetical protein